MSCRRLAFAVLIAGALLCPSRPAESAATPTQQCAAGKNKAAGKYTACRENAEAKLAATGDANKYADALAKCALKFSAAWQKLEDTATAAGASCPGDDPMIKGKTDTYTDTVAALLGGSRFEDNGDGTVTDHETGLQWEKKTTAVGSGVNLADAHDVDNIYGWSNASAPDGTAFTDFLAVLNDCTSNDGTTPIGAGFAGHCDWRLPTIQELQTIVDATRGSCNGGSGPCIDPIFGPTNDSLHWSASTLANYPTLAWRVYFFNGALSYGGKGNGFSVRAVRSPS